MSVSVVLVALSVKPISYRQYGTYEKLHRPETRNVNQGDKTEPEPRVDIKGGIPTKTRKDIDGGTKYGDCQKKPNQPYKLFLVRPQIAETFHGSLAGSMAHKRAFVKQKLLGGIR